MTIVVSDPEILGGTPVFAGTRVRVFLTVDQNLPARQNTFGFAGEITVG